MPVKARQILHDLLIPHNTVFHNYRIGREHRMWYQEDIEDLDLHETETSPEMPKNSL